MSGATALHSLRRHMSDERGARSHGSGVSNRSEPELELDRTFQRAFISQSRNAANDGNDSFSGGYTR